MRHFAPIILTIPLILTGCSKGPSRVELLRAEKAQRDSIAVVQREQTMAYCDSMTAILTPQVDELLKRFRYEKDDRYEDHGHYVHPLLNTDRNVERCFLQPYVSDQIDISIRSYYYGRRLLQHTGLKLSADSAELRVTGRCHHFEATAMDGTDKTYQHEIMTVDKSEVESLLGFIDSYRDGRIRVTLEGDGTYSYVLSDNDKQALNDTYQLAVLMRDIHRLNEMRNQAGRNF